MDYLKVIATIALKKGEKKWKITHIIFQWVLANEW